MESEDGRKRRSRRRSCPSLTGALRLHPGLPQTNHPNSATGVMPGPAPRWGQRVDAPPLFSHYRSVLETNHVNRVVGPKQSYR